jgi:hypothetical protein
VVIINRKWLLLLSTGYGSGETNRTLLFARRTMVKKDDEVSVSSETKGPLKSFQALMGEGEKFSRDKLYSKAIQCYTEVN